MMVLTLRVVECSCLLFSISVMIGDLTFPTVRIPAVFPPCYSGMMLVPWCCCLQSLKECSQEVLLVFWRLLTPSGAGYFWGELLGQLPVSILRLNQHLLIPLLWDAPFQFSFQSFQVGKVLRPVKYREGRFSRSTGQARATTTCHFCSLQRAIIAHQTQPSCFDLEVAAPLALCLSLFWWQGIGVLPKGEPP